MSRVNSLNEHPCQINHVPQRWGAREVDVDVDRKVKPEDKNKCEAQEYV